MKAKPVCILHIILRTAVNQPRLSGAISHAQFTKHRPVGNFVENTGGEGESNLLSVSSIRTSS